MNTVLTQGPKQTILYPSAPTGLGAAVNGTTGIGGGMWAVTVLPLHSLEGVEFFQVG